MALFRSAGVALAAKKVAPRASLGTLIFAAQFLRLGGHDVREPSPERQFHRVGRAQYVAGGSLGMVGR